MNSLNCLQCGFSINLCLAGFGGKRCIPRALVKFLEKLNLKSAKVQLRGGRGIHGIFEPRHQTVIKQICGDA
jgi:hypothetical protein